MKRFLAIIAVVAAVLCATSCGASYALSNNQSETKVVLSGNNFEVLGQVSGQASATYIFGIGGLSKKALYTNAVDEMFKNADLSGSQTVVNITTSTAVKMITPFYVVETCMATGTVIEFK